VNICRLFLLMAVFSYVPGWSTALAENQETVDLSAEVLKDKIHGGLLGQLLGNLNGLPHENKYIQNPGNVKSYTPALPKGARTDDDTDIEWVYIIEMQHSGDLFIPYKRIRKLWQVSMNKRVWCSNLYARNLMDLGIDPPFTGCIPLNPWAEFNISGQFLCEGFGLIAPAMPQTAAKLGLHYTRVAIDGEPAQTTQLFTAMIATAFMESVIEKLIEAGIQALDRQSRIFEIVHDVKNWHSQYPDDWRITRRLIRDKYTKHNHTKRDWNGYELNTASIIGSLLYGQGDFVETTRLAFNFGWDADCNAATAATIVGVVKGRKWMDRQGWDILDRYTNKTRTGMPKDETITRYGDRLYEIAQKVILVNGGKKTELNGTQIFQIIPQNPQCVESLTSPAKRIIQLKQKLIPQVNNDLIGTDQQRACAAYLAICLNENENIANQHPAEWQHAISIFKNKYTNILKQIFQAPGPAAEEIQAKFIRAGLKYRKNE